jgi:transposase
MALGLKEPWKVKDVQMDMGAQRVTIIVECRCGATWADEGGMLTVHGYEERQWRHLDTMQFETIISARVPRVRRPDGSTEMVQVPWAQSRTRWTLMFEGVAVRVLQNSRSIAQACELLRLDWSTPTGSWNVPLNEGWSVAASMKWTTLAWMKRASSVGRAMFQPS